MSMRTGWRAQVSSTCGLGAQTRREPSQTVLPALCLESAHTSSTHSPHATTENFSVTHCRTRCVNGSLGAHGVEASIWHPPLIRPLYGPSENAGCILLPCNLTALVLVASVSQWRHGVGIFVRSKFCLSSRRKLLVERHHVWNFVLAPARSRFASAGRIEHLCAQAGAGNHAGVADVGHADRVRRCGELAVWMAEHTVGTNNRVVI